MINIMSSIRVAGVVMATLAANGATLAQDVPARDMPQNGGAGIRSRQHHLDGRDGAHPRRVAERRHDPDGPRHRAARHEDPVQHLQGLLKWRTNSLLRCSLACRCSPSGQPPHSRPLSRRGPAAAERRRGVFAPATSLRPGKPYRTRRRCPKPHAAQSIAISLARTRGGRITASAKAAEPAISVLPIQGVRHERRGQTAPDHLAGAERARCRDHRPARVAAPVRRRDAAYAGRRSQRHPGHARARGRR